MFAAVLLLAASAQTIELNCRAQTTLPLAGATRVITRNDAQRIKTVLETYLAKAKPELDPPVTPPGDPFIDCEGTVRLGRWILERSYSDPRELRLTYRAVTNDLFIVRQEARLVPVKNGWKIAGISRVTYHRAKS
jgi:hypothetical protein